MGWPYKCRDGTYEVQVQLVYLSDWSACKRLRLSAVCWLICSSNVWFFFERDYKFGLMLALLFFYIVVIVGIMRLFMPSDTERKPRLPSEELPELAQVDITGIVLAKSNTCVKRIMEIYWRSQEENYSVNLQGHYTCLYNYVLPGDSISKKCDRYEFEIFRNGVRREFVYDTVFHSCGCYDNHTEGPDFKYEDVLTGYLGSY